MECFFPFLLLAVIILVLVVIAIRAQAKTDRWNKSYHQLSRRFGGACMPGGWFRRPSVRFRYGTTQVLLDTSPTGSRSEPCTRIRIDWPDNGLWFELLPTKMVSSDSDFWQAKDVDVGSARFNLEYAIRGNDIPQLRKFLSEAVQWQIDKLRIQSGTNEIYVSIGRGLLTVKKLASLQRYDQLEEFTYLCMELYDLAMLTQAQGIEFVEDGTARPVTQALCQVCGEDIVYEMVFCRRCKTPHHLDCWQYYGACSTYGCRETRYVSPKMVGPSDGPK